MRTLTLLALCTSLFVMSCASSEPTARDGKSSTPESPDDFTSELDDESLSEDEQLLLRTRSRLSNHYSEDMVDVPELYLQEIVVDEIQTDPYAGFRVQLLSTRNVAVADSVRDYFIAWADTMIAGYQPDAYVVFRSPHYRVRAGDFQDREKAIHFSGLLKSRYPDAWVVHERISPSKVPADSIEVGFRDLNAVEFDEGPIIIESTDTTATER